MGLISRLLSFVRTEEGDAHVSDAKVDPGGGANVTAHHFACPGDDSHPLPGDYVATSSSPGSGNEHVTGYIDPGNEPQAAAGEKRVYARDGDGAVTAVVWLKNDGTVVIESPAGTPLLQVESDGTVRLGSASANKGVARNGDSVQVTIPMNALTLAVSGGNAEGPASPLTLDGTITSSSGSVKAED